MRFKPINARGVHKIMILDDQAVLVPDIDVRLRHTDDNAEEKFGFIHPPEEDMHLKQYKPGQYARLSEWGFYDIRRDGTVWSQLSPIFIADPDYFIEGEFVFQSFGWFGDGSDGTYTLNGDQGEVAGLLTIPEEHAFQLERDAFFEDLTIDALYALETNGYRLFVRGTLTVNGYIQNNGGDGSNGGNASDGLGGTAGVGGVTAKSGSLPAMGAGGNGGAGKSCPNVSASYNGEQGTIGVNGSSGAYAIAAGIAQYGTAGKGGYVEGYPDAPIGVNSGSPAATILAGTAGTAKQLLIAYLTRVIDANGKVIRQYTARQGNAGGGGGGTGTFHSTSAPLSPPAFAGSGGGGGGAGADGGIVAIFAQIIAGNGTIRALGGVGGYGGNGSDGKRDNTYWTGAAGGGGGMGGNGGNGGLIYIVCNSWQFVGTQSVAGGDPGNGGIGGGNVSYGIVAYDGEAGANGTEGYDGYIIRFGVQ